MYLVSVTKMQSPVCNIFTLYQLVRRQFTFFGTVQKNQGITSKNSTFGSGLTSHLLNAMEFFFFHLLKSPIDQATTRKKRFPFLKYCLPTDDEIPPCCEIRQMDYQRDAFGLLQTSHCFCRKVQCFDDAENKAHAVPMFY